MTENYTMQVDGKRIERAEKRAKFAAVALDYATIGAMALGALWVTQAIPLAPGWGKVAAAFPLGLALGATISFGRVAVEWFLERVIVDSIEIVDDK